VLNRKKACWTEIHVEMDEETDVTLNEAQRWLNTSAHASSGGRDMVPT
jgi:hypothetical protein